MGAQVFSTLLHDVLCTNTAWNIHQTMKRFVKCFFELLTQIFHSVPWERSGRGGRTTAKPTDSRRSSADGFVVRMELTKAGAGLSNPVPHFRQRNAGGKNPDSQGTDVERGLFFVIGHGIIFPVTSRYIAT